MTSVGLACAECSTIEASGGRLLRRVPTASAQSAAPTAPRSPTLTPGVRIGSLAFFALVASPCLWTGSRDGWLATENREPVGLTCGELATRDPPRAWTRVSDCRLDGEAAVIETILVALPDRAWIPLRAATAAPGSPYALVLETHDTELIRRVMAARSTPSAGPLTLDASVEGMVVPVADLEDDLRSELEEVGGMVSGARVLRAGETPPGWLWVVVRLVAGLLVIALGLAVALEREKRPPAARLAS
jgi:hypothetical protein